LNAEAEVFEKQVKPDFSKTCGRRRKPPPYQFAFCKKAIWYQNYS
jgi:hypothetical protein